MKRIIAAVMVAALCMSQLVFAGDSKTVGADMPGKEAVVERTDNTGIGAVEEGAEAAGREADAGTEAATDGEGEHNIYFYNDNSHATLHLKKDRAAAGEVINVMIKTDECCADVEPELSCSQLNKYAGLLFGSEDYQEGTTIHGFDVEEIWPAGPDEDWEYVMNVWGDTAYTDYGHFYRFTMPDYDVVLSYTTYRYGFYEAEKYNNSAFKVFCTSVGHGKIECDKEEVKPGDYYTITITPDPGYSLQTIICHGNTMGDEAVDHTFDGNGKMKTIKYRRLSAEEAWESHRKLVGGDESLSLEDYVDSCGAEIGDQNYYAYFESADASDGRSSSSSVRDSGSSSERGGFDDKGSSSSSEKDEEGEDSSSSSTKKKPAKHSYPADAQPKAKAIQASGKAAEGDTVVMQEQSSGKKSVCSVTPSENGIITVAKGNKFTIAVSGAADFASDDKKSVAVNKKGVVNAKKVTGEQGVNIKYSAGGKNCTLTVKVVDAAKLVEDSGKVTIKKTSIAINAGSSCNICLPDLPYNAKPVGVSGKTGVIVNKAYKPEYLYIGKDGKWHFVCAGAKTGSAKYDFTVNGKKFTIKIKVNKTKGAGRAASSLNALRP